MVAVTKCTTSITVEIKRVKAEVSFIQHDIQKLRERTSALEGRVSTVEDDMKPLLRDVNQNVLMTAQHAACKVDFKNRMRRNNVRAIDKPERVEREKRCGLYWVLAAPRVLKGLIYAYALSGKGTQSSHAPPASRASTPHLPVQNVKLQRQMWFWLRLKAWMMH